MLTNPDKCYLFGHKVPQYFFFMLSGAICDIVQWFIDVAIYNTYPYEWEKSTVCWTLSYTLSIIVRHYSHRLLVFGEFEGSYCSSLSRTYAAYSASIVLSMVSNHFIIIFLKNLTESAHVVAWIITMLWTGILNYFLLKASWKLKVPPVSSINKTPISITSNSDKEEIKPLLKSIATSQHRDTSLSKSAIYSV